ncbi:hypothetical protein [Actinomadura nitritigenes]|uniref:hypothetical protein n=1 Tax=Actinomadura nitritigenes TaxID=134602 RepID=UPI003D8AF908
MLRALEEAEVRPDLVVETWMGALNGAFVAAEPDTAVGKLAEAVSDDAARDVFRARVWEWPWTLRTINVPADVRSWWSSCLSCETEVKLTETRPRPCGDCLSRCNTAAGVCGSAECGWAVSNY